MGSSIADIRHLSVEEQAGYVALIRLRAALGCPPTSLYQVESVEPMLSEGDAVKALLSQATPVALDGVREGKVIKLLACPAAEDKSPHIQGQLQYYQSGGPEGSYPGWTVPERFGADRASRPVAMVSKGEVLLAQAAAVEHSIREYWLSCGYSMGIGFDDSDGPLGDRARELGVIACFSLHPEGRIISNKIVAE